jgi:hypothetical protein
MNHDDVDDGPLPQIEMVSPHPGNTAIGDVFDSHAASRTPSDNVAGPATLTG